MYASLDDSEGNVLTGCPIAVATGAMGVQAYLTWSLNYIVNVPKANQGDPPAEAVFNLSMRYSDLYAGAVTSSPVIAGGVVIPTVLQATRLADSYSLIIQ
jgi:hypothetical protein